MRYILTLLLVLVATAALDVNAQTARKRPRRPAAAITRSPEIGQAAVVMDETLSVLRNKPSLFAVPVQRMRRGRVVKILGVTEADGVKFYRISAPPTTTGWVQADAVFGRFRSDGDVQLARLVQSMSGFDQIEAAVEFFNIYPNSQFRGQLLLLFGDLLEDIAAKLSRDAGNRLDRREMAASGAPLHSYYLNFVSLDRYRRLGITFLFDPATKTFHYDGTSWKEITAKYPKTNEAVEAQKRLDTLKEKMQKKP